MGWNPFRDAATRAFWRELLIDEQRGRCARCGRPFPRLETLAAAACWRMRPTFNHIVPPSLGGSGAFENLRLVHRTCDFGVRKGSRSLRSGEAGEQWCRRPHWKRVHPSLTAAWLGALRTFLQTNRITTPYWCARGCGFWHLTSRTSHVLTASATAALTGSLWDLYHHATDGSWVRRDRECLRGDGFPKKCFATLETAQRCARAMSAPEGKRGRHYHAYICSSGHVHVGALRV